jgi:hypothetical protein
MYCPVRGSTRVDSDLTCNKLECLSLSVPSTIVLYFQVCYSSTKGSTWEGSSLAQKYYARVEGTDNNKHSSLLWIRFEPIGVDLAA